jgi:hypothetical protein
MESLGIGIGMCLGSIVIVTCIGACFRDLLSKSRETLVQQVSARIPYSLPIYAICCWWVVDVGGSAMARKQYIMGRGMNDFGRYA